MRHIPTFPLSIRELIKSRRPVFIVHVHPRRRIGIRNSQFADRRIIGIQFIILHADTAEISLSENPYGTVKICEYTFKINIVYRIYDLDDVVI